MEEASSPVSSGGFMLPPLLSPPHSSHGSASIADATLPHPRTHPLKPGSAKESAFVRFVDRAVLEIQRRYAKRGSSDLDKVEDEAKGYESFAEVAKDVDRLLDLIWVSGTPTLQIPYLLSLASFVMQYLTSFPPVPKATFKLLGKLDIAFASLLHGMHVETGQTLPGFETGKKMSGTEKVRLKSLVDQTRMTVMDVIGSASDVDEGDSESELETADEMDIDDDTDDDDDVTEDRTDMNGLGEREMGVARIYDRTVVELGDELGGSPIGIITDD